MSPINYEEASNYYGITQADQLEIIPKKPGIYAWFHHLPYKNDNKETFLDDIKTGLDVYSNLTGSAGEAGNISVKLKNKKLAITEELKKSYNNKISELGESEFLQLKFILLLSSILFQPLYIGQSKNVYNRIGKHLTSIDKEGSNSNFGNRVAKLLGDNNQAEEYLKKCMIFYIICDFSKIPIQELVEDIGIKTVYPYLNVNLKS